jgi:hypothetical protein
MSAARNSLIQINRRGWSGKMVEKAKPRAARIVAGPEHSGPLERTGRSEEPAPGAAR